MLSCLEAKTLNFSLLYGKTAWSFAKDWDVTEPEAQEVIDRWFRAYPEVKTWMDQAKRCVQGVETSFNYFQLILTHVSFRIHSEFILLSYDFILFSPSYVNFMSCFPGIL